MFCDNNSTYVWVFSVGRGLSCFIKLGCGYGIMYDIGKGTSFNSFEFIEKGIKPHLKKYNGKSYAQVILSHPHSDHISQVDSLKSADIELVTCPNDICENEKINFDRINNPGDSAGLVNRYKQFYSERNPPLCTIDTHSPDCLIEYGIFYYRPPILEKEYPSDDQLYTNSLSLILYIKHENTTILIPGDITPDILKKILNDEEGTEKRYSILRNNSMSSIKKWYSTTSDDAPSLGKLLRRYGLTFLIAPHHGLESGFCKELFENIKDNKVDINIISEKKHHEGDKAGDIDCRYQSEKYSKGVAVSIKEPGGKLRCEKKYSVSTIKDDHVLLRLETSGKKVVISKDPYLLLE